MNSHDSDYDYLKFKGSLNVYSRRPIFSQNFDQPLPTVPLVPFSNSKTNDYLIKNNDNTKYNTNKY
jgi:hypothetical protein